MESLHVYWNKTLEVLHSASDVTRDFYDTHIKEDWQLQGSCVLLCMLMVLCVLVNWQWNIYGTTIMGVDGTELPGNEHVNTTFETFPDEDPLTFTKKNN